MICRNTLFYVHRKRSGRTSTKLLTCTYKQDQKPEFGWKRRKKDIVSTLLLFDYFSINM